MQYPNLNLSFSKTNYGIIFKTWLVKIKWYKHNKIKQSLIDVINEVTKFEVDNRRFERS